MDDNTKTEKIQVCLPLLANSGNGISLSSPLKLRSLENKWTSQIYSAWNDKPGLR